MAQASKQQPAPVTIVRVHPRGFSVDAMTRLSQVGKLKTLEAFREVGAAAQEAPCPVQRAVGLLITEAVKQDRLGELTAALGLNVRGRPAATDDLNLSRRNAYLRQARAAVPAWRDAPKYAAAAMMCENFDRYAASGWHHDRARPGPPSAAPRRYWHAILQMGVSVPRSRQLADILDAHDSQPE